MKPLFVQGHVFRDPESTQQYVLRRDVFSGDVIMSDSLEAQNGAPPAVAGEPMPDWLADQALVFGPRVRVGFLG